MFREDALRVLVTAGPTREYIDDVRFISNPSSGRMGYAVAAEAASRGARVTLLSGPTCLAPLENVRTLYFESTDELYELAKASLPDVDCLVMAAAVGDYRPRRRIAGKLKKAKSLRLDLAATQDVLGSLVPLKSDRVFVGFAVEAQNELENARGKLRAKSMDMLVLNGPASLGAELARFTFVFPDGSTRALGRISKTRLATLIMDEVESLFHRRASVPGPIY